MSLQYDIAYTCKYLYKRKSWYTKYPLFSTIWMNEEYFAMTCEQYTIYLEMVKDQYNLDPILSEFSKKKFIVDNGVSSVSCCNECLYSMRCEVSTEHGFVCKNKSGFQ